MGLLTLFNQQAKKDTMEAELEELTVQLREAMRNVKRLKGEIAIVASRMAGLPVGTRLDRNQVEKHNKNPSEMLGREKDDVIEVTCTSFL